MRSDIQVGSKIKVIDNTSPYYRWRGTVSEERTVPRSDNPEKFDTIGFICNVRFDDKVDRIEFKPEQVACIQKKFIDIEHIKEHAVDLGNGIIRAGNTGAFEPGDLISISEKCDGANASIAWNPDEGKLEIFSRTNLLDGADGLRGFKSFIETNLNQEDFKAYPNYVIFGEWLVPHSIRDYDNAHWNHWIVYDIWDKEKKNYLPQDQVKSFCQERKLEYIHELYSGPFVSWDHCRSFMHSNTYGPRQEGIVVKNQTKLDCGDIRFPKYLKIVNNEFKETVSKKREPKPVDPEALKAEADATEKLSCVVTDARVRKFIFKLIDDGKLPADLKPSVMGILCKEMPKLIWDDLMKEESEILKSIGSIAGKISQKLVIERCKNIVLGK